MVYWPIGYILPSNQYNALLLDELLSAFQGLDKSTTIPARPYFDNDF